LITDNHADYGAGIFNDAGSMLALNIVEISSNTARTRGGGILIKGIMAFYGGMIWGNDTNEMADGTANDTVRLQPSGNRSTLTADQCCVETEKSCKQGLH
jgi:predicted outer membrane repeat protein